MFRNCLSALLSLGVAFNALAEVQPDAAQLAADLAPKIKQELAAKFPNSRYPFVRVAVFPFGNEQGKITPDLYAPNKYLQGELIIALLIDGVNSFYQDQGNGSVGPVIRHPKNCDKWILSGPGYRIIADSSDPSGYRLQSVNSKGHSVIDVPGFQKDDQYADAFLFVKSGVSIAESIGITNDVGVIEAHFYAQKLPGDTRIGEAVATRRSHLGTGAGPQVENPVCAIRFDMYQKPVSVIRIFYGSESDCPIPKNERVAVTRK